MLEPCAYLLGLLYLFEDCMPIMKYCLVRHGFQKPCMISLNSLQRNPSNKHNTKWHDTHAILPSDSNRYSLAVTHCFGFLEHTNDTCFLFGTYIPLHMAHYCSNYWVILSLTSSVQFKHNLSHMAHQQNAVNKNCTDDNLSCQLCQCQYGNHLSRCR